MKCSALFLLMSACCLVSFIKSDNYMHYPRGSNNRLNEKTATRSNNNRYFDSQNNNRGGYNIGVKANNDDGNQEKEQYQTEYFMSEIKSKSFLPLRWTSQHGSGGNENDNPNKLNANYVIQYMCQPIDNDKIPTSANDKSSDALNRLRDGSNTQSQNYQTARDPTKETEAQAAARKKNSVRADRVLNESWESYDACATRERNKGLFTADQNVKNEAKNTRQNPNGQRSGYECPEERDYYPYWHPTEWIDAAIFAKNASMCSYYLKESFNVKPKHICIEKFKDSNTIKSSKHNNEAGCKTNGGTWTEVSQSLEVVKDINNEGACNALNSKPKHKGVTFKWGTKLSTDSVVKACLVTLKAPVCKEMPFGRANHLGNGGAGLEEIGFDMEVPNFPSGKPQRCVMRTRYNITTDDYDGWAVDSKSNGEDISPVIQNPNAFIGASSSMKLAMNTAQFGRTFQDRSHTFRILERPADVPSDRNIKVLSVQGKRGNIVQTYPAVEYDFVPKNLKVTKDELIHVTWTGSNTHNNGGNGGDGQTGDDGQGTGGTDRSNMLGLMSRLDNFPVPDSHPANFLNSLEVVHSVESNNKPSKEDLGIQLGSSGYYKKISDVDGSMNQLLNNASPTFKGALFRMTKKGNFNYTCTRNNNFSNRSQKGSIIVS